MEIRARQHTEDFRKHFGPAKRAVCHGFVGIIVARNKRTSAIRHDVMNERVTQRTRYQKLWILSRMPIVATRSIYNIYYIIRLVRNRFALGNRT